MFVGRVANVGELGRVHRGHNEAVACQSDALIGRLVALEVNLVVLVAGAHDGDELGAEVAERRVLGVVLVQVLIVGGRDALVGAEEVGVRVAAEVLDGALAAVLHHQVGEHPADAREAELGAQLAHARLVRVGQLQLNARIGRYLFSELSFLPCFYMF